MKPITPGFEPELIQQLLTLLDRIEVEEDHTLASQRFDIVESYGWKVIIGQKVSDRMN